MLVIRWEFDVMFLKHTFITGLIGFGLFAATGIHAQVPAPKGTDGIVNLTGCLAHGDKSHQYSMKDATGKMFELVPNDGVDMKKHVGEKVMVTGTMTKHKSTAEIEYLRVNQVKTVSETCE